MDEHRFYKFLYFNKLDCKLRNYDEILGGCSIKLGNEVKAKEGFPVFINSESLPGKRLQMPSGREGTSALAVMKEPWELQTSIDTKNFPCPFGDRGTCAVNSKKNENTIVTSINMALNFIRLL